MSTLTTSEKRKLERAFGMGDGYVLNFKDRTFADFFEEFVRRDINDPRYQVQGTSKAKRLRTFWQVEPDAVVARLIESLLNYAVDERLLRPVESSDHARQVEECGQIALRLAGSGFGEIESAFDTPPDEANFDAAADAVLESIRKGKPQDALDRLHVWTTKFLRKQCRDRGIVVTKERPLHSLMGEYVKAIRAAGAFETDMTERIMLSNIKILETFNDVRNNKSLAHDNPLLSQNEANLILAHIAASVRFMKAVEMSHRTKSAATTSPLGDDIPF